MGATSRTRLIIALAGPIVFAACFGRTLGAVNSDGALTAIGACTTFTASNGTAYTIASMGLPLPSGLSVVAHPPQIVGPDGAIIAEIGDRVVVTGEAFEPGGDVLCASPFLRVVMIERLADR